MKGAPILLAPASPGSPAIGHPRDITTAGFPAAGTTHPMKGATGATRTLTTNDEAGGCTKAIGITRITTAIITMTVMTSTSVTNL